MVPQQTNQVHGVGLSKQKCYRVCRLDWHKPLERKGWKTPTITCTKTYLGFGSVFLEFHAFWIDGGIAHPLLWSSLVNLYGAQKPDSFPGGLWDPNFPLNNHLYDDETAPFWKNNHQVYLMIFSKWCRYLRDAKWWMIKHHETLQLYIYIIYSYLSITNIFPQFHFRK